MTTKKAAKNVDDIVDAEVEATDLPPVAYRVEATAFQASLTTLAELPYNKVGNLLNALRAATPITEEDDA